MKAHQKAVAELHKDLGRLRLKHLKDSLGHVRPTLQPRSGLMEANPVPPEGATGDMDMPSEGDALSELHQSMYGKKKHEQD